MGRAWQAGPGPGAACRHGRAASRTLDPDSQGAVPVLTARHDRDEPGIGLRWRIAYLTPVPGLFTLVTGNGVLGEEWSIIAGAGWVVRNGYRTREAATAACLALGRVLPNTDWMRLIPREFTPAALGALRAVLRRYQAWGADWHPEPEPVTEPMPAAPLPGYPEATA